MIKIKWKKSKGGRAFEHLIEGWVGGEHLFNIEGGLCVTDLRGIRKDVWEAPKHYMIGDVGNKKEFAKNMAFEILNNINTELYEGNLEKQRVKDEHTRKVMKDAQDFLDKLTSKKEI